MTAAPVGATAAHGRHGPREHLATGPRPHLDPVVREAAGATSSLVLTAQTSWVHDTTGITLQLHVSSPLPASRLGIRVVLYSRLGNRGDFEISLTGREPASEVPLAAPQQTIPLGSLVHGNHIVLHLPVTTSFGGGGSATSPSLGLGCSLGSCSGVYPLQVVLWDSEAGVALASLTTHLIYTPSPAPGVVPLGIGLVLPLGGSPALAPDGSSAMTSADLLKVAALVRQLQDNPKVDLSLEVYPQLLLALQRTPGSRARAIEDELVGLLRQQAASGTAATRQLLAAPFAAVGVQSLAAAGLGGDLATQLATGRRILAGVLGVQPASGPFVTDQSLGNRALSLLEGNGFHQLVVPLSGVTPPLEPVHTVTAPFRLSAAGSGAAGGGGASTAGGTTTPATTATTATTAGGGATGNATGTATEAFAADPVLATHFDATTDDPVLAAHQFLAELATIYFDDPSLPGRGVVVAPSSDGQNATFLANVLAGLGTSPVLASSTLTSLFATIAPGANGSSAEEALAPLRGGSPTVPARAIRGARATLRTVTSIVPGDRTLLGRAGEAILEAETSGLRPARARAFAGAPARALAGIARRLSISGAPTITLTSRTGRIPVTVLSKMAPGTPVHVLLELRSAALTFPPGNASRRLVPLTLSTKDELSDIRVTARTSGESRLDVALVTPVGGTVLVTDTLQITSTAVSGLAVALSIGALLVLAAWWFRSYGRHRRRVARQRGERAQETAGPAAAPAPPAPA